MDKKEKLFHLFLGAIIEDCKNNPEKLHETKQVWDHEWDELLKGIEEEKIMEPNH